MTTVLVVEDEADILLMERYALEFAGYRVIGAASAEEALMVLRREIVDVMVLDLRLPGMSGWELLGRLREDGTLPELPVVVATAHASETTEAETTKAGCRAYLIKPFSMEELSQTIDNVMGKPRA